uniref:Uncharacterized protein n=1 Tax=viral metagenome TaxID=1070528 RepID=A0A6C0ENF7_9ZZZZ
MNFLKLFIISLVIFIILDGIWISSNFNYYMTVLKKIQKEPFVVKIPPIIISYICLSIALYLYLKFIIYEIKEQKKYNKYLITILYGFLFGLAVYGTYSFTCCTYFKNYTYYDGFKDTLWGIILFCIIGLIFIHYYE